MASIKKKQRIQNIINNTLLIIFTVLFIFPLYIMINTAVKSKEELATSPYAIPKAIEFSNFAKAVKASNYFTLFANSLLITIVAVTLLITISSMASYVISRNNSKYYKFLYIFFVCGLMIPFQLIMLPLYKMIGSLGLINNSLSLIFIYLGLGMPFLVFYNVGFLKTIPKELDEAAFIDGASKHQTFWKIIFPLMKTSILTVAVLQVIWVWNDFLMPLLFLNDYNKMTIMVGIYSFMGEYGTDWTMMFALIVISILPVFILYIFLQKYIVEGFIAGALKG